MRSAVQFIRLCQLRNVRGEPELITSSRPPFVGKPSMRRRRILVAGGLVAVPLLVGVIWLVQAATVSIRGKAASWVDVPLGRDVLGSFGKGDLDYFYYSADRGRNLFVAQHLNALEFERWMALVKGDICEITSEEWEGVLRYLDRSWDLRDPNYTIDASDITEVRSRINGKYEFKMWWSRSKERAIVYLLETDSVR